MKLSEHIKALLEKRNGLAQETNTEGDSILTVRAELDKAHKSDCASLMKMLRSFLQLRE
jgi:hypothetical protein